MVLAYWFWRFEEHLSGRQGDFQSMVDDDSVLAVYMVTQAEHRLNSGKGSPLMPAKGAIATKEAL